MLIFAGRFLLLACLLCVSFEATAQSRVAFVASSTGTADFSSWPEATPATTGLDAADSICVNRATAAGLANPGSFVALVSDSNDDLYCRVHGLSGKRAANCGEGSLPSGAGPWVRTDGLPWADATPQQSTNTFSNLLLDESGQTIPHGEIAWMASVSQWTYSGSSCSNWTDDTSGSTTKFELESSRPYQFSGTASCSDASVHLVCLELGSGPAPVFPEPQGNLVFITGATGDSNFDAWPDADDGVVGIEAADSICNNRAVTFGLPYAGSYKAWLSDSTVDARDRFAHDGPISRIDGLKVANNLADLLDGTLEAPINRMDNGQYGNNSGLWTGTLANGTADSATCGDWDGTAGNGRLGRSGTGTGGWTDFQDGACSATNNNLMCLSTVDFSPNRVFATVATGTGNMASWLEAADETAGLAAADSICRAEAADAGLRGAENFVAWLSDENNDAWCRVQGLNGKRSNNCNVILENPQAGPWVRTDGLPAAGYLSDLVSPTNAVFTPPRTDQYGALHNLADSAWVGTNPNGTEDGGFHCSNWTSTAVSGRSKPLHQNAWSSYNTGGCNAPKSLICVEKGTGSEYELPPIVSNIAFLTPVTGNGNLAGWPAAAPVTFGIEAADSICNHYANDLDLPWKGSYKAWLSDSNVNAIDRFEHDGPRQRPDGITVANNLAQLASGALSAAIFQTADGAYRINNAVWTGTLANGTVNPGLHCDDWGATTGTGGRGISYNTNAEWTESSQSAACTETNARLYCISDVIPFLVFGDGFETGDDVP